MALVATPIGVRKITVGNLEVVIEHFDKNYLKLEKNFDETSKNTKDYIRLINNLITVLKLPRGKIEKGLQTGFIKIKNKISDSTLSFIGDVKTEIKKDNKTHYKNIEKVEEKKVIEHCFIHKQDNSISYTKFEYNETEKKLKNYGKKKLFEVGLSPTLDSWLLDEVYQESFLIAFEINEDFEKIYYKILNRELKKFVKSNKKFKYLSELTVKEEKQQEELEEYGFINSSDEIEENDEENDE